MDSAAAPSIAVVIPAYRAEDHIASVLDGIPSFVSVVIVVDDCSPDRTAELVGLHHDQRVRLVSLASNQGVGGAVLTGYSKAVEMGAQILVKMDSDGQMNPLYLPALIAPIRDGRADYTKGNRFLHARNLKGMPWIRRIGNTGLSFLAKLASGYWNIFDPANGYTAIHAKALGFLQQSNIDRRYFFETSMLIELGLTRAVVKDIYIPAVYAEEPSFLSEIDSLAQFPFKLFRGFLRRIVVQYFIRDFNTVSMLLLASIPSIVFGLAFGIYHWAWSANHNTPTNTGTVMISVLPVILGVQFLLQALALDIQGSPSDPLQASPDWPVPTGT